MKWKVYTDGSFNNKAQTVGWAYILIDEYGTEYKEQGIEKVYVLIETDVISKGERWRDNIVEKAKEANK